MAWNDRFKGSKYTPGEWRKGLTTVLFRKVAYIDKRHKYGKGMEADELVCAELIELLDLADREILALREVMNATVQPEVGGDMGQRLPDQPAKTARNSRGRFERAATGDNQLVGQL